MKIVFSKKSKHKKKKKDSKFRNYWLREDPKDYVDLLTAEQEVETLDKTASSKLEEAILTGKLKQNEDGFVYVDVDDGIIDSFYKLLKEEKKQKPPYQGIGAHISVMHEEEIEDIEEVEELWEDIEFTLGKVYSTEPDGWEEMERVWFIEVFSPQLENIREKYGLSKKCHGHEFHISIATRKR